MSMFAPATKAQSRARVALIGPSGSGKTWTGLMLAQTLAQGGKVAVVDTERGSASKYADVFRFDVCEPKSYSPEAYVAAIQAAEQGGYAAILIDSLTHAWSGKDGALELVDKAAARSRSGNSFAAWREVTPLHNALIDAMLQCKCHLIATMRVKQEYVIEEDARGKKTPRKIGLAPVQRDGMEYEFDVVADMDVEHRFIVSKTRCPALDRAVIDKPGKELGETLLAWLSDGSTPPPKEAAPAAPVQQHAPPPAPAKSRSSKEIIESKTTASALNQWLMGVQDKMPVVDNLDKWKGILFECDEHMGAMQWTEAQKKSVDAMLVAIKNEIERGEMDAAASAAAVPEQQDEVPA